MIWWSSVVVVWSMFTLVGASRTYLGVHYASDVVGSLLLALVFVAGSELLIGLLHRRQVPKFLRCGVVAGETWHQVHRAVRQEGKHD